MICGSGGSKSRLAKAASAEPSGQMRDEKLHAVVARSTFEVKSAKTDHGFGPLLDVQMSFCVVGAREYMHLVKSEKKRLGFVAVSKALAGVGHLRRIWKDAFRVARAVQETCS